MAAAGAPSNAIPHRARPTSRHCRLGTILGQVMVQDLGSSNGTYVNGRLVTEAEVRVGDVIHLGGARLKL